MDLAAASQRWVAHPRRSGRNAPVAPAIVERLINDSWSREDLDDGLGTAPDLALVAAQFDHSNALPAEGNSTGSENDLFDVTDAGAIHFGGSVIFSTGCHSGLSVSDILIAPTGGVDGPAVATDWAQTIFGRGAAAYLGYTGYGHGDDTAVALSEALMVSFACGLEGYATVGEALLYAKQDYAADLTVYGAFDEKALVQATLYGIPFFRLGNSRVDEPVPDPTTAPASTGGQSFTGTFDPELIAATDGTDEYWYTPDAEGGEQLQVTRSPDPAPLRVGGDPAGPATARAVYDLAAHEDNADAGSVTFALEPAITTYLSPEGPRQKVTMAVGALEATGPDGTGTMRLYEGFEATRYYAVDPDGDRVDPVIERVEANAGGGSFDVGVAVRDESAVSRVLALVAPAPRPGQTATWQRVELRPSGGRCPRHVIGTRSRKHQRAGRARPAGEQHQPQRRCDRLRRLGRLVEPDVGLRRRHQLRGRVGRV